MKVLPRDSEKVEAQLRNLFIKKSLTILAYQVALLDGLVGLVAVVQMPNDKRFYVISCTAEFLIDPSEICWGNRAATLEEAINLIPASGKEFGWEVIGEVVKV